MTGIRWGERERENSSLHGAPGNTKSGILGIGAPFGGKIHSALVERLQKFCQPGGC